ncbi:hypothetical protein KL86PLE_130316 [uncultured Pleomorphomonas sp.]|uniref:Uncharacterized protein n=1 Tax=uncultured Pleomorphomonas sp. TaxID=442121 RepID=A0A212LBH7_9HYPH|nr:hypothetical protein [uncultured Pleomorphomonas sp.]SCM74699.1 hypothetical protein KL86PLE_130316 [uncultured Pleomorphomonas sp.]
MGEVVKLDKKAREARRKAQAARAAGDATGNRVSAGRTVAAIAGGLILVLMIGVTFFL